MMWSWCKANVPVQQKKFVPATIIKLQELVKKYNETFNFDEKTSWAEILSLLGKIRPLMSLEDKIELNWLINLLSLRWAIGIWVNVDVLRELDVN